MAGIEQGYEDECFESVVSKNYHCAICFNVFKEPVMCRSNEHLFCRACITRHLKNAQTCPSCMDELSVDTLREAPRIVTNCLSEFKIRCEFFHRGCRFVELGQLDSHVKECGYAPAMCSNEGCGLEVNKRDLIHHETAVCEQRKVQCHNCEEMRQELIEVNEKLDKMEEKFTQLNETLKEINVNLAAQNEKMNQFEALQATVVSLQRNNRESQETAQNYEISEGSEETIPRSKTELKKKAKLKKKKNRSQNRSQEEVQVHNLLAPRAVARVEKQDFPQPYNLWGFRLGGLVQED